MRRSICSRLSFTPKVAPGEFGASAGTYRAEAQASRAQVPRARQTSSGCSLAVVGLPGSLSLLLHRRTVVRWHRAGFRLYWSFISKVRKRVGRKRLSKNVRDLIFRMGCLAVLNGSICRVCPMNSIGRSTQLSRPAPRMLRW
jgi:hypothetical protein